MDGFAKAERRHNVMGYYDETDLPFYYGLAEHLPDLRPLVLLGARARPTPTAATSRRPPRWASCPPTSARCWPPPTRPTAPSGSASTPTASRWNDYAIDLSDILLWPTSDPPRSWRTPQPNRKLFPDFLADCLGGTLPQVSIIGPGVHDQYDEGSRDVQNGEAYSSSIINAVMGSPLWEKTVIFFTYDEHGGYYDHVPPPGRRGARQHRPPHHRAARPARRLRPATASACRAS